MSLSILKTGAIAATVVILSVTSSFAAFYGTVNFDVKVKKTSSSSSATVYWLDEGDSVKVIGYTKKNGGKYKVDPPGPNNAGYVPASAIDVDDDDFDDDDINLTICGPTLFFGGNFCIDTH